MKKLLPILSLAALALASCVSTGGATKSAGPVDFDLNALAQYTFDEKGDGEIPDLSGNENAGIVDADIVLEDGVHGKALVFNGQDTYVLLPDEVLDSEDGWSFCAWVKPEAWADWCRLFDFGSGATSDMWLGYSGIEQQLRLDIFAGEEKYYSLLLGEAPAPGEWTHVAVTFGNDVATLYLNGEKVSSNDCLLLPSGILKKGSFLGRSNWAPDPLYTGMMDDVLISGTCFTEAQIQSIMTGFPARK